MLSCTEGSSDFYEGSLQAPMHAIVARPRLLGVIDSHVSIYCQQTSPGCYALQALP